MPETSGDSRRGVSGILFPPIHVSFTTHVPMAKGSGPDRFRFGDTGAALPQGDVTTASEVCVDGSATQTCLRCRPLIAPVTFSTLPAGQDASCTKATS